MQPHVPTSIVLEELLKEATLDHVSLNWLIGRLQKRSFGLLMLILALIGLAPGVTVVTGLLLAYPAIQMMLARDSPTLPRLLADRRISTRYLSRLVARAVPLLRRIETFVHPRWHTPFQATKRIVGLIVLFLAITLISPIPFSHVIPTLVIMLISLAYLEEDGILLCISLVAALISIVLTAATVWAAVSAAGLIERLWIGA